MEQSQRDKLSHRSNYNVYIVPHVKLWLLPEAVFHCGLWIPAKSIL
jgi:hypothetical protein